MFSFNSKVNLNLNFLYIFDFMIFRMYCIFKVLTKTINVHQNYNQLITYTFNN